MELHFESWPVKFAIVGTLLAAREFVRMLSPVEADGQRSELSKSITETLDSAAIALGLVLFIIQPFLLQAFFIPSGSMEDTLRIGDRLLVSKLVYKLKDPDFQDVVVFRAPKASGSEGDDFIKRCIGTGGHVIEVKDRQLFRDGKPVKEPYPKWSSKAETPMASNSYDMKIVGGRIYSREYDDVNYKSDWKSEGVPAAEQDRIEKAKPEAVPNGNLLMLGDHRNNSNDSHAWGFVPRENVVGKAICVFWPPNRSGLVDRMSTVMQHPEQPKPMTQVAH